ncbi:MAG: AarF/UbiB family protein [Myxococcota bacterium]
MPNAPREESTHTADVLRLIAKYGGPTVVSAVGADRFVGTPAQTDEERASRAMELAHDLELLGPTYVKLGQILASRPDLLRDPYRSALSRLHNDVQPLPWSTIDETLTTELGDWKKIFGQLSEKPLAAASIGQVHRGRLVDGTEVAVKVQRPGVKHRMLGDLDTWMAVARVAEASSSAVVGFRPVATLQELRVAVLREFDYEREAANLMRLDEILKTHPSLVVPGVIRDASTSRVLTMTFVEGDKVSADAGLDAVRGIELADALFEGWLDQIVVRGFFHADPHPGNILITPEETLAVLDAGMVGVVPVRLRRGLVKLLLAIADGRIEDAAETFVGLAPDPDEADPHRFRDEVGRALTGVVGDDLRSIQTGALLLEMQQIATRNHITVPPSFTMIGKALLQLDEIARTLHPGFRPDEAIREHAAALISQTVSQAASGPRMLQALIEAEELADALPDRVARILQIHADNRLRVQVTAKEMATLSAAVTRGARILSAGGVLAACLVGLAILASASNDSWFFVGATSLIVAGITSVIWLSGGLLRDG